MAIAAPLSALRRAGLGEERFRLIIWLFCWVNLPNLAFCLLWMFGAPPRTAAIIGTGVLGLAVRRCPRGVQFLAFVGALGFSAVNYVSAIFNLAPSDIVASIRFLVELKPTGAREYLVAAVMMMTLLAVAAQAFRLPSDFRSTASLLIAVGSVGALAALDHGVSQHSAGAYNRVPQPGAPFSSAVEQSRFLAHADGKRHLILVMVEAMGDPRDPALRDRMLGRWYRADIREHYRVRTGRTPYYGSTTSGEMRELCGRWATTGSVLHSPIADCLPARLRKQGYRTTAMHSFTGEMFDRKTWYPSIGFDALVFRDAMVDAGARRCSGVFPGACDPDVPRIIGDRLRHAHTPQFLYWLTVNSHLPVPASDALQTQHCLDAHPDFPVRNAGICRLSTTIERVEDALATMLLEPGFPEADILIVGDHMPPFFDHGSRSQFDGSHVPWILLTRRNAG